MGRAVPLPRPERRLKMRNEKGQFVKGSILSDEAKAIISAAQLGHKVSEATKLKISLAQLGEKNHNFGKHPSDETRAKLKLNNARLSGENNHNFGKFREEAPAWKGGKTIHSSGYVLIWNPHHPYCNNTGYVYEHRLVMEKLLDRYLLPEERIHHINGITNDNRIKNLMLFENDSKHSFYHHEQNRLAIAI